jgi:phosphoadenosine phosphosulfate reductase
MTKATPASAAEAQRRADDLQRALRAIGAEHAPAALASSLGAEDMVLTDAILCAGIPIEIFTLDTGQLHPETLGVLAQVRERYAYDIDVFRPDAAAVERYVNELGLDAIYRSVELRRSCCEIRKVEPLGRALAGKGAWVTGLRRKQSTTRADLPLQEFIPAYGLWKFNPLAEWSEHDVWDYLRSHNVPYNPLHDRGFRSIGCAPCTRPTATGEDLRAGRWWWEDARTKECGLHQRSADELHIEPSQRA